MAFNPSGAVTGATVTGLTTPTYTPTASSAPDVNGKQFAILAIGGTQTGVTTHSSTSPFTVTMWIPKLLKFLGALLPLTGRLGKVEKNVFKVVTRKGVTVLAGQPAEIMVITTTFEVPAGSDVADAPNVKAAVSAHLGILSNQSDGIASTLLTNVA